ncbi:glutamyl-tRNA reductase [Halobacteria archaeon AArc-dxtr1]|nr:glutamyl-tRNA reductase [Halobacteria archaeon AArc-dxtr1]
MTAGGLVTSARVTHERADVDQLAAASPSSQRAGVAGLLARPGVSEAFVLSTCNRVEAYVVAEDGAVGRAAMEGFFASVDDEAVVVADHDESITHLLQVACGLESVVIGEDQIIGQVRRAYEDARTTGGIGSLLEMAVTKAIHVGERARTETAINEGIVSLGSAATRLAGREIDLTDATALVVGAGEMGQLAARAVAATETAEVVVANRTVAHAEHVVRDIDDEVTASAAPLTAVGTIARRADVIMTATGSDEPVLETHHLDEDGSEQVVVDLGQPRDVAPGVADVTDVSVYDLDDLESVTTRTREQRAAAAREVEVLIDREVDNLHDQYKRAQADDVIATMYESAEQIKRRELETAKARLAESEGSVDEWEIIESMADALVGQLLAPPTQSLREAAAQDDWETIYTALRLFDPGLDDGPPSAMQSPWETGQRTTGGDLHGIGTARFDASRLGEASGITDDD